MMVLTVSIFGACSDSGNSTLMAPREGVFVDAPVEGLYYATPTLEGITGPGGVFEYREGEAVCFSVGGIVLGEAPANVLMSPLDLVPGAVDETDPAVTNICRFLITLDDDNDLMNGIQISDRVRREAESRTLAFHQAIETFESETNTQEVMQALTAVTAKGEQDLVLAQLAQIHLHNTLGLQHRGTREVLLADYLPEKWEVGEKILGLEITRVEVMSYGMAVDLENPFVYLNPVALTPDGESTAILCPDAEAPDEPISLFLKNGYTFKDIAAELQGAVWGAAFGAVISFAFSPVTYCSADDPWNPSWWVTPAEGNAALSISTKECPWGEPPYSQHYECEQGKCVDKTVYERLWKQRLAQRALNDDVIVKMNVASYMVYYHIILTGLPEDEHALYEGYKNSVFYYYKGVIGNEGVIERQIYQPEYEMARCLYNAQPPEVPGEDPNSLTPNYSFNFGAGPVVFTYGLDGSWAISGGEGLIVGIGHNPNTKTITVTMAVGVQGNLGPYGVSGSGGIQMTIQDEVPAMKPFVDVSLDAGPLSCSLIEENREMGVVPR
jgi:hypothetical protein